MGLRYPRRYQYTRISAALSDQPVSVPLDWLQQLSRPVLRKSDHATQAASGGIDEFTQPAAPEVVTLDWLQPLSGPTRRKKGAPPTQFVTDLNQIVISLEWHQPLATPVWSKRSAAETQSVDEFTQPAIVETVTLDKWYAALSEPTRRKKRPHGVFVDEFTEFAAPAETVTIDKWYVAPADVIRPQHFDANTRLAAALAKTAAPALTPIDWYMPLVEPVRPVHIGYLSGETQILLDIAAIPDIEFSWYSEWPDVVASRWSLWRLATSPEWPSNVEIAPDTWLQPLSEPVRRKHFDPATVTRDILVDLPPPPEVFADTWYQPASTPVPRIVQRLTGGEAAPVTTPVVAPEEVTLDKWFVAASEPRRGKRHIRRGDGESAPILTPPETITADKWHLLLSHPLFAKHGRNPATGESAPVFVDPPPPTPPDYGWFMALVGPVPRLVSRHAALAQAYGDPNVPLPTAAAPDDDWTDTTPEGGIWTDTTPESGIWTDVPPQGGNWG